MSVPVPQERRPVVSVVVPAYQNAAFVEATVESVLAQTFTDFELVVSDHGSTDGTWERLQRFTADPRVRLERISPGGGAARNWNSVTALARGQWVKLVCGDDLLYPTCLEEQVAAARSAPSAVLVACTRDLVDARGEVLMSGRGLPGLRGLVPGREAVRATVVAGTNVFGEPACVLVRRDVLEQVGGWDGTRPYLIDEATYVRCLLRGDLVALPRTLVAFRLSAGQWSVALARQQSAQAVDFHHAVAAGEPGLLSRRDVVGGDLRARGTALLRRAAYLRWRRRMAVAA